MPGSNIPNNPSITVPAHTGIPDQASNKPAPPPTQPPDPRLQNLEVSKKNSSAPISQTSQIRTSSTAPETVLTTLVGDQNDPNFFAQLMESSSINKVVDKIESDQIPAMGPLADRIVNNEDDPIKAVVDWKLFRKEYEPETNPNKYGIGKSLLKIATTKHEPIAREAVRLYEQQAMPTGPLAENYKPLLETAEFAKSDQIAIELIQKWDHQISSNNLLLSEPEEQEVKKHLENFPYELLPDGSAKIIIGGPPATRG